MRAGNGDQRTRPWARDRRARAAVVCLGVGGLALLIAGFTVNPGPPTNDNLAQLVRYGLAHQSDLRVGGWMQVTAPR